VRVPFNAWNKRPSVSGLASPGSSTTPSTSISGGFRHVMATGFMFGLTVVGVPNGYAAASPRVVWISGPASGGDASENVCDGYPELGYGVRLLEDWISSGVSPA
jgi:hypothetical protein